MKFKELNVLPQRITGTHKCGLQNGVIVFQQPAVFTLFN